MVRASVFKPLVMAEMRPPASGVQPMDQQEKADAQKLGGLLSSFSAGCGHCDPAEFESGVRFFHGNREASELEIALLFDGSSHKAMTSS